MNQLRLVAAPGTLRRQVLFWIDDVDLVERVAEVERVDAGSNAERRRWAGYYCGPPPEIVYAPSFHLFGFQSSGHWEDRTNDGRVPLLSCGCGTTYCCPLYARIVVGRKSVAWRDFSNPRRPNCSYDDLGPFRFDLIEYKHLLGQTADAGA